MNKSNAMKSIQTNNRQLFPMSDLMEWYNVHVMEYILKSLEEFQERDSGWALARIQHLIVNVNKCNPMRVGCWLRIPRCVQVKRAVINVNSSDNACFAWSIVAALRPVRRNTCRVSQYPHYSSLLNFDGIPFPVTLQSIARFERQNDVSVNVFALRERRSDDRGSMIVPLRITDVKRVKHVNLLYLRDNNNVVEGAVGHFALIRDLSRLVGCQLTQNTRKKFLCDRCLHYFYSSEKLLAHSVDCGRINDCAVILPHDDNKWLFHRDESKRERLPFVIYADLECLLSKNEGEERDEERISARNTLRVHQHHRVFSVGYYLCSKHESEIASMYRFYRGIDCVSWFADELNVLAHRVRATIAKNKPMSSLTSDELRIFGDPATCCHICGAHFEFGEMRVRDHCHMTGRYRGPAHTHCNLNYKRSYNIPVFFHNMSGYDAHFIISEIANAFEGSVELLPLTKEKYIAFIKNVRSGGNSNSCCSSSSSSNDNSSSKNVTLRFLDSYRFLNASLDKLVSYINKDKLTILRAQFPAIATNDFDLLTRKGVFPYEYVDNCDKLLETKLPSREDFYSSLIDEIVSESDYAHATRVWESFGVRTIGEYSDLYLKTDVLLLADVFENFRDTCIDSYKLDPAHYFTLPGFTWDAMLKYTRIRFELLTDIDMVLFVERGVRGGLSQCVHRYARANNKYMPSYNSSEVSSYLMYYDINNLYGWAMCEFLPYAEFKWVENVKHFDVMSIASDSNVGYILEVDLWYPQDLHNAHADLPFCPTRAKPPGKHCEKLLTTLYNKRRYVAHYRVIQQCLRYGLRLTRIHRVLQFAQSDWLRGYIELNTEYRIHATTEFERELYKLMNNAVFGKTLENVRDRIDVKLVTRWDGRYGAEAMISRPNFHSRCIFSEDLMAVELRKLEVMFNKPIYVGMSILDISKTRLYEFHYDYMRPSYEYCKILYMDTDSFIYHIVCEDVYEGMRANIERFDTSDYADDNVYGMPRVNKKKLGLMKDENNGGIMCEFVGLRAKMYAVRVLGRDDVKKIKGINRSIVARTISFDDYVDCMKNATQVSRRQLSIRSKLHEVYTVSELKLALSPYDDKRYVKSDFTSTLPWGHFAIDTAECSNTNSDETSE